MMVKNVVGVVWMMTKNAAAGKQNILEKGGVKLMLKIMTDCILNQKLLTTAAKTILHIISDGMTNFSKMVIPYLPSSEGSRLMVMHGGLEVITRIMNLYNCNKSILRHCTRALEMASLGSSICPAKFFHKSLIILQYVTRL